MPTLIGPTTQGALVTSQALAGCLRTQGRQLTGLTILAAGFFLLGGIPLVGAALGDVVSPLHISILRLASAAAMLSPFAIAALLRAQRPMWLLGRAIPSGLVVAAATATYQASIARVPVALAIVLVLAGMITVAALFDQRRPPAPLLATVMIALGQAVLLAYPMDAAPTNLFGIVLAALCGGVFGLLPLSLRRAEAVPTMALTGIQFAAGGVGLVMVDLVLAATGVSRSCVAAFAGLSAYDWLVAAIAGALTAALPYGLIAWGRKLARASDLQVAFASSCEPVAAVAVAVACLGQPCGFALWVALGAVVAINLLYPAISQPARSAT